MKSFLLLFAAVLGLHAQSVFVPGDGATLATTLSAANPTGSCTPALKVYNYTTGHTWGCVGSPGAFAWVDLGGPLSSVSDQLGNDMGLNEDHPQGIPATYGYWSGSYITIGNAFVSNSKTATLPWAGMYVGPGGTQSTNTAVQVRKFTECVLNTSWTCTVFPGSAILGEFDSEDWQNWIGSATITGNTDGSFNLPLKTGSACNGTTPADLTTNTCLTHFYGNTRIGVSTVNGVVAYMEARLVLINANGPDDRARANFMLEMGADAYISTSSSEVPPIPAVGGGKFKFVTTSWRSYAMSTLTPAQLLVNPPPFAITAAP